MPSVPVVTDSISISSMTKGLLKHPNGSFSLSDGHIIGYDEHGEVLARRFLGPDEVSVLHDIEKRTEKSNSQGDLANDGVWKELWPGSCSPPIACTKSSTCTGRCSNCVKVGFFPIRFCAQ
jgi:hypothetical protein